MTIESIAIASMLSIWALSWLSAVLINDSRCYMKYTLDIAAICWFSLLSETLIAVSRVISLKDATRVRKASP